jgi:hypothetical protein
MAVTVTEHYILFSTKQFQRQVTDLDIHMSLRGFCVSGTLFYLLLLGDGTRILSSAGLEPLW